MGDDSWDDDVESARKAGVTPEVARKLLQMNPSLRDQGHTTARLVEQSSKQPGPKSTPPVRADGESVYEFLKRLFADTKATEDRIAAERKKLAAEEASLNQTVVSAFEQWLLKNDADLRSPVTQSAIEKHQKDLQKAGFTVGSYIKKHREK